MEGDIEAELVEAFYSPSLNGLPVPFVTVVCPQVLITLLLDMRT